MAFSSYRAVLAVPAVGRTLLLGLLIRVPMWAASVVLTLHVVSGLGRSYTEAGLVVAVATVAAAVSGPWRGRLLDRHGLRATVLPSLVVLSVCWSVAPFVAYPVLVPLAGLAGLFVVPTFSVIRQVLIGSVPQQLRTTALVLDSVAVEISFMAGPALGVLAATTVPTSWALFVCEFASILGGAALWWLDPPLHDRSGDPETVETPADAAAGRAAVARVTAGEEPGPSVTPSRLQRLRTSLHWLTPQVLAVLAVSATATVVLTGTDVSVVAALREWQQPSSIGWILAVWGLGSAIGGLVYGALHRPVSPFLLVALLGLTTAGVTLADDRTVIAVLLFVAGLFCAPTITATIDLLSRSVPVAVRGEAMGWHGSAMTVGSAAGAPLVGVVLDHVGWHGGFLAAGGFGVVAAATGLVLLRVRRSRSGAAARPPAQPRPDVSAGRAG